MEGSLESWSNGFGVIVGEDRKTYAAHYTDFDEYKKNNKRVVLDVGQDVTFEPSVDTERRGRKKAINIQYDSRPALHRFAGFRNYEQSITELAQDDAVSRERWCSSYFDEATCRNEIESKAADQDWLADALDWEKKVRGVADVERAKFRVNEKIEKKLARRRLDVLFSYIERTFERLQLENKIVKDDAGETAAFNTGLGDKYDKDIFAVFRLRRRDNAKSRYEFERFANENHVGKRFPKLPELADYFRDAATGERVSIDTFFFDVEKKIIPDYEHLFDERRTRFPDSWQTKDDEQCSRSLDILLESTKARVRRNFRTAVPFYFPTLRKLQMLLPITFEPGTDDKETRAVVVSREGAGYSVETIMPLNWAYKNARLVAKPDREDWLDF